MKLKLTSPSGKSRSLTLHGTQGETTDFSWQLTEEPVPHGRRLRARLTAKTSLALTGFAWPLALPSGPGDRFLVNGYQSWSESREYGPSEALPPLSPLLKPIHGKHKLDRFGDLPFTRYSYKPGRLHSWSWTHLRRAGDNRLEFFGSLAEDQGFTCFRWSAPDQRLTLERDLAGARLEAGQSLDLIDVLHLSGPEAQVYGAWFDALGLPVSTLPACTGWTSWYNYYTRITEDLLLNKLEALAAQPHKLDFFQIDDGFQTAVGDWFSLKPEFPRGMGFLAAEAKKRGFKPGLWLAPFICDSRSDIYKNRRDWIAKDERGQLVLAGCNIEHWQGNFYALDFYHPEVRAYLTQVFRTVLDDWGYDLVKLDFLYAVCLQPRPGKTRGQIMAEAMQFLRDLVGPKQILGCGVPLAPAFGRVDYCRIGCDVSLGWEFTDAALIRFRERVSTISALSSALARANLDRRAFLNDPDVFILRTENTTMNPAQKRTLCLLNQILGSLVFFSDDVQNYSPDQADLFGRLFPLKSKTGLRITPLPAPKTWKPKGPLTGLVTGYQPWEAAFCLDFSIQGQTYQAWTNLSAHPRSETLGPGYHYRSDSGDLLLPSSALELGPWETVLCLVSDGSPGSLAGTDGHIVPGSELASYSAQGLSITAVPEPGLAKPPRLLVWGPETTAPTINGHPATLHRSLGGRALWLQADPQVSSKKELS